MNRRQFLAGVAVAPMAGVGLLRDTAGWVPISNFMPWSDVPLPYNDPSVIVVQFYENMNRASRITAKMITDDFMNFGDTEGRGTLHDVS